MSRHQRLKRRLRSPYRLGKWLRNQRNRRMRKLIRDHGGLWPSPLP